MPHHLSADRPFAPARFPFFYGWCILGCTVCGLLASIPGQTMGVSVFTDSLIKTLHLSRSELSLAYLAGTLGSALLLTHAGRLYDRFGARRTAAAAALGLGLVLLLLGGVRRVGTSGWGTFVVLSLLFMGLRFTGQGMLTLISRNMLMKWFARRRGLVNGISSVFFSFAMSASPILLDHLIRQFTWRGAWWVLALLVGVGFPPFVLLFFRDNPEACGLTPDGDDSTVASEKGEHGEHARTLGEARRTLSFWCYALALSFFGLYMTALTFHITSIFEGGGMTRAEAVSIFLPSSVIAVSVSLLGGWLSDSIRLKWLLLSLNLASGLALTGVICLAPGWPVWLLIVGAGTAGGLMGVLSSVTWPRHYGRTHLGAISGFSMALIVCGSSVGPAIFGSLHELTGRYTAAGCLCLGMAAFLAVLSFWADPPAS